MNVKLTGIISKIITAITEKFLQEKDRINLTPNKYDKIFLEIFTNDAQNTLSTTLTIEIFQAEKKIKFSQLYPKNYPTDPKKK